LLKHVLFLLAYELRIIRVVALKHRLPLVYVKSRLDALGGLRWVSRERRINVDLFRQVEDTIRILMQVKKKNIS
jgi:hypothetical protein